MQYALLVYRDESAVPRSEAELRADLEEYLGKVGSRLAGSTRLQSTATATTVRVREHGVVIADGPFAETKEQIGGFLLVDCEDLDEAIELAAQMPVARFGTIEVRPVREL